MLLIVTPSEREAVLPRFEALFERDSVDVCWPWKGAHARRGYGRFRFRRSEVLAHRVAYALYVGPVPDGLFVLHRCDNPPCCNPAHLFLGDHAANAADREAKGRGGQALRWGEQSPHARLTAEDVIQIRRLAALGVASQERIGRAFGVGQAQVSAIHRRRTWRHVAEEAGA